MNIKPAWLIRRQQERAYRCEIERKREEVLARIKDVCWDIDVWRDERPGMTLVAACARLGANPTLYELQAEYGQLLRVASRHGVIEEGVST